MSGRDAPQSRAVAANPWDNFRRLAPQWESEGAGQPGFVVHTTPDGVIDWVSDSVFAALGWQPEQLVGRNFLKLIHPDSVPEIERSSARLNRGESLVCRSRVEGADGEYRWVQQTAVPLKDQSGTVTGRVSGWRLIPAELAARQAFEENAEQMRAAMDAMLDPLMILDPVRDASGSIVDFIHVDANAAGARHVHRTREELIGTPLLDVVPGQAAAGLLDQYSRVVETGEPLIIDAMPYADEMQAGEPRLFDVRGARAGGRLVLTFRDVTEAYVTQADLAYQAFHDPLTGLRNRSWLLDSLEAELRAAPSTGTCVGVMFVDLDNFKVINDSLGHAAGDDVLRGVARRIAGALKETEFAGRFGGDEFIVVAPGITTVEEAEETAARVSTAIAQDVILDDLSVIPTVSIGVALSNADSSATTLLRDADAALARAKASGRARWQVFDGEMLAQSIDRLRLEAELRSALRDLDFVVHYQPIVSLPDREVAGYEALVRWQHHERGLLLPAEFLHVAGDSGLIAGIGRQVLAQVCQLLLARPDITVPISINVSPVELASVGWLEGFSRILDESGVPADRIIIEVTETGVLTAVDDVRADLKKLRELGVGVHIDDFGTGFSSISLLRDLPVTGIKLDGVFVADLDNPDTNAFARALSAGLAELAVGLGLAGIAEGVETESQVEALIAQGWPMAQGYLFGRPGPLAVT